MPDPVITPIVPVLAVARGGPHEYAVLNLITKTVVSKHTTESAAMRVLERSLRPEPVQLSEQQLLLPIGATDGR